ncbi:MAG: hypothetical protein AAF485_31340, partial [Chloroflexota bacterium]
DTLPAGVTGANLTTTPFSLNAGANDTATITATLTVSSGTIINTGYYSYTYTAGQSSASFTAGLKVVYLPILVKG